MAVVIFSRRGIHYNHGNGAICALFVPSTDQIITYREAGNSGKQIAQRAGIVGKTPLWRNERAEVKVYGELASALEKQNKAIQVWLPSDFVSSETDAFFFIFNKQWVVHGAKHYDDERKVIWRTTLIEHEPNKVIEYVVGYIANVMLDGSKENICLAIEGSLQDYEEIKSAVSSFNIVPQPFSTLKIAPKATALYKHSDYTLPMLISLSLFGILLVVAGGWWFTQTQETAKVEKQLQELSQKIAEVQSTQTLGYIQNPEEILDRIKITFNQQPSAVIDAAGRFGAIYGDLEKISFDITNAEAMPASGLLKASDATQQVVIVETKELRQKLLSAQEKTTKQLISQTPWVRQVANVGSGEDRGRFHILLQISSADELTIPSSSIPAPTLVNLVDADISPTLSDQVNEETNTVTEPESQEMN